MIVDATPMRATTILAEMSRAGVRVAAVTAIVFDPMED
jgi:phosphonoacetate hydrolase